MRSLDLGSTTITDAGLPELAAMPQLRSLVLLVSDATPAGVAALEAKLPDCRIQYIGRLK
ncbi:hypothetical protein [Lignipirellula cremea]|nr:hypothetical protein [Lignipirellula cremea]